MIGRVLQVNRRGKKTKNLQGFKTGTLGLKWKHENKEKRGGGAGSVLGKKHYQFSSEEKENRDIEE